MCDSATYEALINKFDTHFKIKDLGFAERYKFHKSIKSMEETIQNWAARVHALAAKCAFKKRGVRWYDEIWKEQLR